MKIKKLFFINRRVDTFFVSTRIPDIVGHKRRVQPTISNHSRSDNDLFFSSFVVRARMEVCKRRMSDVPKRILKFCENFKQ